VIGLGRRRPYDDEGLSRNGCEDGQRASMAKTYFVVCSLLLPLGVTFVHNDIFRLGILNLDMGWMRIFTLGVGRVR
jgi:hypothetical protein